MPEFRAAFSMNDAQEMLEGRTIEFHSADLYKDAKGAQPVSVRLIEYFGNVDNGATLAAELAFNGLREYLAGTDVVLLTYFIAQPGGDPLALREGAARAAFYGVQGTPTMIFDGVEHITEGGDDMGIDRVYQTYRQVLERRARSESAWSLNGQATAANGLLTGTITLNGPAMPDTYRLSIFLCEKILLVPGGNTILLHRHAVRSDLCGSEGVPWTQTADAVRQAEFKKSLSDLQQDIKTQIDAQEQAMGGRFLMKPVYIDPSMLIVAAFIQDQTTHAIVAAAAFDVTTP